MKLGIDTGRNWDIIISMNITYSTGAATVELKHFSAQEAANMLGVSKPTIFRWFDRGLLRGFKRGILRKDLRIYESSIKRVIREGNLDR